MSTDACPQDLEIEDRMVVDHQQQTHSALEGTPNERDLPECNSIAGNHSGTTDTTNGMNTQMGAVSDSESESESDAQLPNQKVVPGKKEEEDSVLSEVEEELEVQNGGQQVQVSISTTTTISFIGKIVKIVQNSIVVEHSSKTQQTLDIGSILCLNDKTPLGPVFETFGPVVSPFYRILIPSTHETKTRMSISEATEELQNTIKQRETQPNTDTKVLLSTSRKILNLVQHLLEEIDRMGKAHPNQIENTVPQTQPQPINLSVGEDVYFVEQLSKIVKPEEIYTPGCDASTFNDKEEEENIEFSDDEAEKNWKKKRKFSDSHRMNGQQRGKTDPQPSPTPQRRDETGPLDDPESNNWRWQNWPKGGRGQGNPPPPPHSPPPDETNTQTETNPSPDATRRPSNRFPRRGRYGRRSQRTGHRTNL